MKIKTNQNTKFILSLSVDIDMVQYQITLTLSLFDRDNGSRKITRYRAEQLQQAIEDYNQYNTLIFG